jgi:hypothetical protein
MLKKGHMVEKSIKTDIETKQSAGYWANWLVASKATAKEHWDVATKAWNEYLLADNGAKGAADLVVSPPARFPLFWSSIKNLQPAYYARTPETVAKRMFDTEDHDARVACLILERLSKYSMSQYPIDDAMIHATLDFLIADKATARVFLEEVKEVFTTQVQVLQTSTGEYIDAQTGEVMPPEAEITFDGVSYTATVTKEELTKVCTDIVPIPFSDILHTPNAQSWCDVKTIAFKLWLSRAEFAEKFGSDKLERYSFGAKESDNSDSVTKNEAQADTIAKVTEGIEVWEIWDKPDKKVMYLAKGGVEFLDVLDDPYELRDFFPCAPFIIGTKPPKSLYPTPMFKQLEPMIDQLHRLFTRITKMTSGLRRRGIADKSMTDVIEAINQLDDFEIIGSAHYAQLVEAKAKGADPIWYLPLTELATALNEAQALLAQYKQLFFEISGVPDVVRGVTDARETAAAQQQKGEFYNVRSSWDQHLIQELARKLIEMQCDLAIARMPDSMIWEVCHLASISPEDQPRIPAALQLLKNDKQRAIRIEIETDSLTFTQNAKKQEEKNLLVQTVMQGLKEVASIGQSSPAFLQPAMAMLLVSLRGVDLGKAYEQQVETAVKGLEEMANTPPPPPPPDYEGQKVQIQQQKLQLEQMAMQMEQTNQALAQSKEQFDQYMRQQEFGLKTQEVQIKASQVAADQQMEGVKVGIAKQLDDLYAQLEGQKVQIEQYRVMMSEKEKLMEERRLDQQKVTDQINLLQTLSQEPKEASSQPPVIVNLNTASSKKLTLQRDPLSGAMVGLSEVIPDVE